MHALPSKTKPEERARGQPNQVAEFERSTFGPLVTDVFSRFVIKSTSTDTANEPEEQQQTAAIDEPDSSGDKKKKVTFKESSTKKDGDENDAAAVSPSESSDYLVICAFHFAFGCLACILGFGISCMLFLYFSLNPYHFPSFRRVF